MAQKKCFSVSWEGSLRFTSPHETIRSIIFVPCLCHKTNNALIHAFKNNDDVKTAIIELRDFGKLCYSHQDDLKAKCPCHVTRHGKGGATRHFCAILSHFRGAI